MLLDGLTKRYGNTTVVDGVDLSVCRGTIAGLLGPNGAGKSTTLRMMLGMIRPTTGTATFAGTAYRALDRPLTVVGSALEASAVHPRLTVRAYLSVLAASNAIPDQRADVVLEACGLGSVASRQAGRLSLGMGQRLAIAAALIGDPTYLVLDEPTNGLDPAGVVWLRDLLTNLAREGRAILVSSHLMAEQAATCDRVVIMGRGRVLANMATVELLDRFAPEGILVRTDAERSRYFGELVIGAGGQIVANNGMGGIEVCGLNVGAVSDLALLGGIPLRHLTERRATLEEAFLQLTQSEVEFAAVPLVGRDVRA